MDGFESAKGIYAYAFKLIDREGGSLAHLKHQMNQKYLDPPMYLH